MLLEFPLTLVLASLAATVSVDALRNVERRRAITNGNPDEGSHPQVGLMVGLNETGLPILRCSGTLLSSNRFLTAGHCIPREEVVIGGISFGTVTTVGIYFDEDMGVLPGGSTRYWPEFDLPKFDVESTDFHAHPKYNDITFAGPDVGVVKFNKPYRADEYGVLPSYELRDLLTAFRKNEIKFTYVGYGLTWAHPQDEDKDEAYNARQYAEGTLINESADPYSFYLDKEYFMWGSINAKDGGICYGDSGGPAFLKLDGYDPLIVAGVISWGAAIPCTDGVGLTRIDHPDVIGWINGFL